MVVSSITSPAKSSAFTPSFSISSRAAAFSSRRRLRIATLAHSLAKSNAVASPMPAFPPVMKMVLLFMIATVLRHLLDLHCVFVGQLARHFCLFCSS